MGMRVKPEAQMRDGIRIEIVLASLVPVEPISEGFRIDASFDLADEAVAHLEPHRALDHTDIGEDPEIPRLQDDGTIRRPFIGIVGDVSRAPLIDAAALLGEAILAFDLELAALPGEIGSGIAQKTNLTRIA